jgi:MAF protein
MRVILASSSPYRAELLKRIITNFSCDSPAIDETALANESGRQLVMRLAIEKTNTVANRSPNSLVIGCDQVACLAVDSSAEVQLGKPGSLAIAEQHLAQCSGKTVNYITACCLINTKTGDKQTFSDEYLLHFRSLNPRQITRYLSLEKPFDCAGAIKSEGLGVTLINRHEGNDPTSLVGLPLIKLSQALEKAGYDLLENYTLL